jgi:hypothetical protein
MPGPGPGSGLNRAQLRSRVKDQATFAEQDSVINEWLNEKHKQLVVKAKWDTRIVTLGSTVVGQSDYPLDSNIFDLEKLKVGVRRYRGTGIDELWDLGDEGSGVSLNPGVGGVFAITYTSDGTAQFTLAPTPEGAESIQALALYVPADLADDASYPIVPEDLHENIADGAIALGYRLRAENSQEAAEFEARFETAIGELRARKNMRGQSGPVQIGVKGVHF